MTSTRHDITIDSEGISLAGAFFVPDGQGPHPALAVCHGMPAGPPPPGQPESAVPDTQDMTYPEIAELAAARGLATLIFNFRGTGASGGNFHPLGWAHDLEAVLSWLWERPEVDVDRIGVLGSSMGARVAIYVTARRPEVAALISFAAPARTGWRSAPEDMVRNARETGIIRDAGFPPSVEDWRREFQTMDPVDAIARVSPRPLLIMHGDADDVVPPDDAHTLYARADHATTEIEMLPGAGHRFRGNPTAIDKALTWLLAKLG